MKKPQARLDAWAEAQKRFHLSDLHIQMARELGCHWFRLMSDAHARFCWTTQPCRIMLLWREALWESPI